jgi:hypothetical protein
MATLQVDPSRLEASISRSSNVPLLAVLLLLNGATVSTLYWAQSVAGLARLDLGASLWISLMPSAALVGYAIGVALLAAAARDLTTPSGLGLHALLLGVGLSAASVAPAAPAVAAACVLIGVGCSLTQRALACATSAVPARQRGPVIGCVIASGLTGIVAARAIVPAASVALGWRTMFILDAALMCTLGLVAAIAAGRSECRGWDGDREPMPLPSAWRLWRREPVLRRAALQQACVFAVFNGGWAVFPRTLAHAGVAGAVPMGTVASLGAVAAVTAGWLCRQQAPSKVALAGFGAAALAAVSALCVNGIGPMTYAVMTLLDIGTQTALVANQAQAQARATSSAVRGRIAAIVTAVGFAAGAAGAAIGNALL